MTTTVHPTPDTAGRPQPGRLVDEIVAQLRGAGVETSEHAVRVLAIHAHRCQLDTGDLVAILSRFEPGRRWSAYVRRRAAQLLADVGAAAAGENAVTLLELDVATACGFVEYQAWRASLDQPGAGERPDTGQPRPDDLDMARADLIGAIDGILNASNPAMSDSDRLARIRQAYERYRGQRSTVLNSCTAPATAVVEGYTPIGGRAHGSLDRAYYSCAAHVGHIELLVHAMGMTPHRGDDQVPAGARRCGDVWDYTKARRLDQPERERLRLCAVCGEPVELVTEGPDPYWWRHVDVIGGPPHAGRPGQVM